MNRTFPQKFALDLNKRVLTNVDAVDNKVISQSIESIIMTSPGERIMFSSFGSPLNQVVFSRLDSRSGEMLLDSLISLILKYETRITILSDLCSLNISRGDNSMNIKIVYVINKTSTPGEFNKKIVF